MALTLRFMCATLLGWSSMTLASCGPSASQQSNASPSGTSGSKGSSDQQNRLVSSENSSPTSSSSSLDLAAAKDALIRYIQGSSNPSIAARLPDLSLKPIKGPLRETPESFDWKFGNRVDIRVFDRSWNMDIDTEGGEWIIYGEFVRDADGQWNAKEISRRGRGNRGGS